MGIVGAAAGAVVGGAIGVVGGAVILPAMVFHFLLFYNLILRIISALNFKALKKLSVLQLQE